MSKRVRITPRPKLAAWLEAKAKKYGLPLAATAEQLLFGIQMVEEASAADTERPAAAPQSSSTMAAAQLQPAGPGEGHDTRAQALAAMREREQQTPLAQAAGLDDIPAWQAQAPDEVPSAIRLDGAQRYIASNGIAETRRQLAAGELEAYWWSSAVEYALEK